jgi:hypothetical protein
VLSRTAAFVVVGIVLVWFVFFWYVVPWRVRRATRAAAE